jgi:hypothetical protein
MIVSYSMLMKLQPFKLKKRLKDLLYIVNLMLHELTLTLKPYMFNMKCQDQFAHTKNLVRGALSMRQYTCIAELTESHNIHYHILIDVDGIEDKDHIINRFRGLKQFGRFTFKGVSFEESFKKYIVKALKETGKFFDPVVFDFYNLSKQRSNNKYIQTPEESENSLGGVEVPQSRIAPALPVRDSDPERFTPVITVKYDEQTLKDMIWYNKTRKPIPEPSNSSV